MYGFAFESKYICQRQEPYIVYSEKMELVDSFCYITAGRKSEAVSFHSFPICADTDIFHYVPSALKYKIHNRSCLINMYMCLSKTKTRACIYPTIFRTDIQLVLQNYTLLVTKIFFKTFSTDILPEN